MKSILTLVGLYIIVLFRETNGFALYMTKNYCNTPILNGTKIMGQPAMLSSKSVIKVFQGNNEIINGSTIYSNLNFSVNLEPKVHQMVLECSRSVSFENGQCDGVRTNINGATLLFPPSEESMVNVRVVAAWATGYSDGVKVTDPFYFTYSKGRDDHFQTRHEL